jgi:hypothetical protein
MSLRLFDFVVLRKLAVGPIEIEPKRVRARYTATSQTGEQACTDLVYTFDEPVFEPRAGDDVNLACMMTAQVALNYGLFCEQIEFDGLYDTHDRRFLLDMLENTSREIYLNKLLAENVFLLPNFKNLQFEKRSHYTAAKVEFSNSRFHNLNPSDHSFNVDLAKNLVLSSGGKDSLLTYGLLREMGQEAHPIFVNESGRHWFTALNAFRHLKETQPLTARVWSNCDRVFAWMLRQFPFIRPDFADVRADIY